MQVATYLRQQAIHFCEHNVKYHSFQHSQAPSRQQSMRAEVEYQMLQESSYHHQVQPLV